MSDLREAAKSGDLAKVQAIVKAGGVDVNIKDRSGYTPLHLAAMFGHNEVAKFLMRSGANPEITTGDNETAYDLAKHTLAMEMRKIAKEPKQ